MPQKETILDDNGNPVGADVILDDNGVPVKDISEKTPAVFPELTGIRLDAPRTTVQNPSRKPGEVGREDEQMFGVDQNSIRNTIVDKIALSPNIPESLKPNLAVMATFIPSVAMNALGFLSDPTAPALGVAGAGRSARELLPLLEEPKSIPTEAVNSRLELNPQKSGTPVYNTPQFGLSPSSADLPYPLNTVPDRLRPPSTNATVFDALLPDSLKYNKDAPRLTTEVVPPSVVNEPLPRLTFNGKTIDEIDNLVDPALLPPEPAIGTHGSALPIRSTNPLISGIMPEETAPVMSAVPRVNRTGNIDVDSLDNPIAKLIVKLRQARPLNKEQQLMYRAERAKRAANVESSPGTGSEWARNVKQSLAGPYEKVRFEALNLEPTEVESLLDNIRNSPLDNFQKPRAIFALEKVMRGSVPQKNEINLLSSVFTHQLTRDLKDPKAAQNITAQLLNTLYKKKPWLSRTVSNTQDVQRTIMSSMDMSAPFRQGAGMIYDKAWWTSWDDMFKAWKSEDAARAIDESIRANPYFKKMQQGGLSLTDTASGGLHEEGFGSNWAEKYIPFVKRSERAYGAFLNKLRADSFSSMMDDAVKTGANSDVAAKAIADYINTVTGRASLGKMEKYSDALNQLFYSPRLMSSRIQMMEPMFYIKQPDYVRKQAWKSALSIAGLAATADGLGKIAGGSVEIDPRSADFGKLRFGDTRIDPGAGVLQYITATARLISQSTMNQKGEIKQMDGGFTSPTPYSVVSRFLENKASPSTGIMLKGLHKYDPSGKLYNMPAEVAKTYIPMVVQDITELMTQDPDVIASMPEDIRSLIAAPATFFGMGSQTYK